MAELWTDPSFEDDAPGLTLVDNAVRSMNWARTGLWSLELPAQRGGIGGTKTPRGSRTLDVTAGVDVPISAFVEGTNRGAAHMYCYVDFLDGFGLQQIAQALDVDGVQFFDCGLVTPSGPQIVVEWRASIDIASGSGTWYVDDVSATGPDAGGAVALGKWLAINAAKSTIATINGSAGGFKRDLGGRVYTRLVTPEEIGEETKPYCCLPLDQDGETLQTPGTVTESRWRLTAWFFLDEVGDSDPRNSPAVQEAAELRDDIVRAFLLDPTLGGQVDSCEVTAINSQAGVSSDYAEIQVTIEFLQYVDAATLAA